ncbi:hypothetical protein HPB52_018835 [Rhipicephalus sanguineus]|uniref:Uncharacterized protein n=1 Tax=Rhipicephalus sanguineus TaxID=34632 RepID=A0A9D4PHL8_RHISA|nr:hypothetical protein HPB52_018835 [Rhipicephalus sanguineus]
MLDAAWQCVERLRLVPQARSEQEEVWPTCCEEVRRPDQVAVQQSSDDFMHADADAERDTREVLHDEEIVQLVSVAQVESDDVNNPDTLEASMPKPSQ